MITDELKLELAAAEIARRRHRVESEELNARLRDFIEPAWKVLKPAETFRANWHIDAICDHLEAVSAGEIKRLQIWVPRATMKSLCVSVIWPAWEWTKDPWLRYWSASYELGLAGRLVGQSLNLIKSRWYQERWGHLFQM